MVSLLIAGGAILLRVYTSAIGVGFRHLTMVMQAEFRTRSSFATCGLLLQIGLAYSAAEEQMTGAAHLMVAWLVL